MKRFFTALLTLALFSGQSQTVNWSQDIAPILYKNCTSCHHNGGLAPFSMMTYNEAKAKGYQAAAEASARTMPPWTPDPHYTRYAHERVLSSADIKKINDWVAGGMPEGNSSLAPTPPVYTNGSALGTPDLSVRIPTFTIPANQTDDIYQCFAIPTNLLQDKFITGFEIIPGDPSCVHHVVLFADTTNGCIQLDNATPGPGYVSFGGAGHNKVSILYAWVPGSEPYILPQGMGFDFKKNSTLVVQVHYPKGSNGKMDSTLINLKFSTGATRPVFAVPFLNHFQHLVGGGQLFIPANEVKTLQEHNQTTAYDASILSIMPHCHLLGKKWLVFGVTPALDTIPIFKTDNWDFHWQGTYAFRNILKLPGKTHLYAFCTYDNTTANTSNPNNPPKNVSAGEATSEEMMAVLFNGTLYLPGDENILADTNTLADISELPTGIELNDLTNTIVSTPQLYEAAPNPARNTTTFSYFMPLVGEAGIKIFDGTGKLVEELKTENKIGFNYAEYNTANLPAGNYYYTLNSGSFTKSKTLVVVK